MDTQGKGRTQPGGWERQGARPLLILLITVRGSGFIWNIFGKPKKDVKQRSERLMWFKDFSAVWRIDEWV